MWPVPRIPYQMSSDRSRLAPLNGKPLMVNPVVAIEYWPFDRPSCRPPMVDLASRLMSPTIPGSSMGCAAVCAYL
jgi:allantoinase